jgi:hypothetical protein
MIELFALRGVLGLLVAYHVSIGLLAVFSPRMTARVSGPLYALEAAENPQLRYGVRMLGLYALAIGVLLALALWKPAEYTEVIVVVCGLQLARAACRVVLRHELSAAFNVPPRRNALNASLLVAEALVLAFSIPMLSP